MYNRSQPYSRPEIKINIILLNVEASPSLLLPVMQEMLLLNGHDCRYINLTINRPDEALVDSLAKQVVNLMDPPHLIGISCMTTTYLTCVELTKHLRKYTSAPIVFGGVHPTVKPLEVLEIADYVCVGEGEDVLVELASRIESNERTDNILNLYLKKDGQIIKNNLRPLINDLDRLPVPSFNLSRFYMHHRGQIVCLEQNQHLLEQLFQNFYFIITSRGCPYRCSYCLNDAMINIDKNYRVIRKRSNQHILSELINFRKVYKRSVTIGFVDDDFCAQKEDNLKEFLSLYREQINLPFFLASTPTSLTNNKMKMMVESGLCRLEIGIQSASDEVNKSIFQRYASRKKLAEAIDLVRPYKDKLRLSFDVILDNPWETEETELETLRFVYTLPKPSNIGLFSLCLYPGTSLYSRALKEGRIINEVEEIYKKNHMSDLQNSAINALFLLHVRMGIPPSIIELLIKLMRFNFCRSLLCHSMVPLRDWPRQYQQLLNYIKLFFDALKKNDISGLKYYFIRLFIATRKQKNEQ